MLNKKTILLLLLSIGIMALVSGCGWEKDKLEDKSQEFAEDNNIDAGETIDSSEIGKDKTDEDEIETSEVTIDSEDDLLAQDDSNKPENSLEQAITGVFNENTENNDSEEIDVSALNFEDGQDDVTEEIVDEEIDTSDWKVYRNEEYGFEIDYPKNSMLRESVEDGYILFTNPGYGAYGISIIENPKKISLKEWLNTSPAFDPDLPETSNILSQKEVFINGEEWIETEEVGAGSFKVKNIYFAKSNKIFVIGCGINLQKIIGNKFNEYLDDCQKSQDSFKFNRL